MARIDKRLQQIAEKIENGKRLTFDDGVALYESPNLIEIGRLANTVRERLHEDRAYYTINLHINPTNEIEAGDRPGRSSRTRASTA